VRNHGLFWCVCRRTSVVSTGLVILCLQCTGNVARCCSGLFCKRITIAFIRRLFLHLWPLSSSYPFLFYFDQSACTHVNLLTVHSVYASITSI